MMVLQGRSAGGGRSLPPGAFVSAVPLWRAQKRARSARAVAPLLSALLRSIGKNGAARRGGASRNRRRSEPQVSESRRLRDGGRLGVDAPPLPTDHQTRHSPSPSPRSTALPPVSTSPASRRQRDATKPIWNRVEVLR